MRSGPALGGLLAALLVASAARSDSPSCAECRHRGDLSALFVSPRSLGAGWQILSEAPVDPQGDPELRAAGVRATLSRHYTREVPGGGAEVCSVEIWSFGSPAQARRARAGLERAGWHCGVHGDLLVMLHGVALRRGERLRPALLPPCERLADLIDARAEESLRGAAGD